MSNKPYFNIVAQGLNEKLQREQIEIEISTGKVIIFKTDDGFSVEVYDEEEDSTELVLIESMIINDSSINQS